MLDIDKSEVDFLVTENMAKEVKTFLEHEAKEVRAIADDMAQRNIERLYFVACGSPLSALQTAQFLVDRYSSIPCGAYDGADFVDNPPYKLDETCAVVAVSQSGKTEEVTEAVKVAKTKGAFTVAFTNDENCPLYSEAERSLAYHAECIWELHLLISYTLVIEFITKKEGPSAELGKITSDLYRLPQVLDYLVGNLEQQGKELGERASKWNLIYTVSGGPLKPLGYKEGVITLMEFTWTHGCALESGEFRHGPLEIVEPGVQFIFLLGTDNSRQTTERALNFVKRHTDDVIVFDYADLGQGLHPMLAPMVLFVPLEWFCYYLAIYKDHNPDNRRYYGGLVEY